jgi:hypothetical protein
MTYNILKDYLFYAYLGVFVLSAVFFVNSIKKLTALYLEDKDNTEKDEVDNPELPQEKKDSVEVSQSLESPNEEEVVIDEKNGEVEIKSKDETDIKIEFNDEESLFNQNKKSEESTPKHTNRAEEFIMALNNNLEEIKANLSSNDISSKIERIEVQIDNIEKNMSTKFLEMENKISALYSEKKDSNDETSSKTTPKYIYKYIEDIVDDYENIDKEMIRKRLKVILKDLESLLDKDSE